MNKQRALKQVARIVGCLVFLVAVTACAKVEVGQTWTYKPSNPFSKITVTYEVIAISDDHVLYRDIETGRIDSSSIYFFKIDAEMKDKQQKTLKHGDSAY